MAVGKKGRRQQKQHQSPGKFERRNLNINKRKYVDDARQKIRKNIIVKSEAGVSNNCVHQLYTNHFDARNKINAKKKILPQTDKQHLHHSQNNRRNYLEGTNKSKLSDKSSAKRNGKFKGIGTAINSNKKLKLRNTGDRQNFNKPGIREFTFTGKSIKISTTNDLVPKERKALVKGKSLSIVTKNRTNNSSKTNYQQFNKTISNTISGPRLPCASPEPILFSKKPSSMPAKVVISNLHPNVSQEDILELFGAIGPLQNGRLKSVGTAEVVYRLAEDAFAAYNKYHGRNLDGQPMILKITTAEEGGSSSSLMMASRSSRYDPIPSSSYYPPPVLNSSNVGPNTSGAPVVFTVKL